ncbi:MAG: protein kinase [Clostridia bacterium]|nr:protein kinase [Clostridia bacterium]
MKKLSSKANRIIFAVLLFISTLLSANPAFAMYDGKSGVSTHAETPGKHDRRYTFTREIGRGGFGNVNLYMDTESNRPVAIKSLFHGKEFSEEQLRKMQKVDSPYVAKAYGLTEIDGKNNLVMEYVDGGIPFIKASIMHQYSKEKLLDICIQLVKAFKAFCDAGLEHIDLGQHTGNVLIDIHGNLKIIDYEDAFEAGDAFMGNMCQALIHVASLLNATDNTLYDKMIEHLPGIVFLPCHWSDNTERMYPGGLLYPTLRFENLIKILEDMKNNLKLSNMRYSQ